MTYGGRGRERRAGRNKRGGIGKGFWEVGEGTVVGDDVLFGDAKFPVEDLEKLSLYPVHVSLAKDTGSESPMDVA